MGCFSDSFVVSDTHANQPDLDIDICIGYCHDNGLLYAALHFGFECICTNDVDFSTRVNNSYCHMPCSGNVMETCGGFLRSQVYSTGITLPTDNPRTTLQMLFSDRDDYVGCFTYSFGLSTLLKESLFMDIDMCVGFCKDKHYTYAALNFGFECNCLDHVLMDKINSLNCDVQCAGKSKETCGGQWAFQVHRTGNNISTSFEVTTNKPTLQRTTSLLSKTTFRNDREPLLRSSTTTFTPVSTDEMSRSGIGNNSIINPSTQPVDLLTRSSLPDVFLSNVTENMFLSTNDVVIEDSLMSWIASQESSILRQLKSSSKEYITIEDQSNFLEASWIGNATNIEKEINTKFNQSAFATVQILVNNDNLAMVFVYIESDNVLTGPSNDVPVEDITGSASGDVIRSYLVSGVLSISIYDEDNGTAVDAQVMYTLPIVPLTDSVEFEEKYACVFFDIQASKWSSRGCHVNNVTEKFVRCFCSHLTSFSVLMQISKNVLPTDDEVINSWITVVGLSVSIVTLSVNLIVYLLLRNKITLRYKIHINLIVCTLAVDILFLTVLNQTNSKVLCTAVSILLHYLVLCMFMWMLAEAVFLVLKVVYNKSKRFKYIHYMLFCYTTPAFIVAVVTTFKHECYVTDTICWLKVSCRLSVAIPACLIIGINIFVLGKMIHVIYRRSGSVVTKPPKKQNEYKQLRNAVRGTFVLLPILGLTWIIGVLNIDSTSHVFMTYLFNILNSLQGLFLFVVCCILDNQIMDPMITIIAKYIPRKNKVNITNQESAIRSRPTVSFTGRPPNFVTSHV